MVGKLKSELSLNDVYVGREMNVWEDENLGDHRYFYGGINPADISYDGFLDKPIILSRRQNYILEMKLDKFYFDKGELKEIHFSRRHVRKSYREYSVYDRILNLAEKGY